MFACVLLVGQDLAFETPFCALVAEIPDLELTAEACASSCRAIDASADMMAAKRVDLVKSLDEWVGVFVVGAVGVDDLAFGAVDFDARGT